MAHGEKTKQVASEMWLAGQSLTAIQHHIENSSTTTRGSVKGWILDWERSNQNTWSPMLK